MIDKNHWLSWHYQGLELRLEASSLGLVSLDLKLSSKRRMASKQSAGTLYRHLLKGQKQINAYLDGDLEDFDLPYDLAGATDFRNKVWKQLQKIPFGNVCTYHDIALAIKTPGGQRAVGGAVGKNPLPLLIPCHRVVAAQGIGGFSGGLPLKRYLLKKEGLLY